MHLKHEQAVYASSPEELPYWRYDQDDDSKLHLHWSNARESAR